MAIAADLEILADQGWTPASGVGFPTETVSTCQRISFSPLRGNREVIHTVIATRNHRWPLLNEIDPQTHRVETYDVRVGDIVPSVRGDQGYDGPSWLAGFLYGIGHSGGRIIVPEGLSHYRAHLRNVTDAEHPAPVLPVDDSHSQSLGDVKRATALGSFVKGWATTIKTGRLQSSQPEVLHFFMRNAPMGGHVITGMPTSHRKPFKTHGIIKGWLDTSSVAFCEGTQFAGWQVCRIEPIEETQAVVETPPGTLAIGGIMLS